MNKYPRNPVIEPLYQAAEKLPPSQDRYKLFGAILAQKLDGPLLSRLTPQKAADALTLLIVDCISGTDGYTGQPMPPVLRLADSTEATVKLTDEALYVQGDETTRMLGTAGLHLFSHAYGPEFADQVLRELVPLAENQAA